MINDTLLTRINESMPLQINEISASYDEDKVGEFFSKTLLPGLKFKIREANIPAQILKSWNYYLLKLYALSPEATAYCIKDMKNHFHNLIENEAKVKSLGDGCSKNVILTPEFCTVWFKTSILVLLNNLLQDEDYAKEVAIYLEDNYFNLNNELRVFFFK
ncbi:hypothetical protein SAMN02745196_01430 [Clostridium collagenovorans DSM 3089]|uniref:Uncharacterized protein n=1 Tax=Clostridium collagenovorans DSM 3089 TaxID=1121306 RepID=A0A1M5VYG0_9CLOT|nr:hypothetical protein [Clostridium collagenovorans]SHH80034.1 hypothetical protein SAMN02745196_01430 [Clostridium collagenovorans DSM 3089]